MKSPWDPLDFPGCTKGTALACRLGKPEDGRFFKQRTWSFNEENVGDLMGFNRDYLELNGNLLGIECGFTWN